MPIVDADIDFLRRQRLLGSSSAAPESSMTEQYLQALGEYPKFPQYKEQPYFPSTARRILGVIAGAGLGPEAQERVKYAPYNNAMRGYGQRMSALGQGAQMEMEGAKTAAEVYRNRLLGQKAAAEAAIQPQRGEYYSGTGAYRKFLTTPEYGTQQEGIRRAGVAPRVSTFGQQGKALVVMPEGTATTYEVAPPNMQLTDAARIRAGATTEAARISAGARKYAADKRGNTAKFMNPQQQRVANQVAAQNVKNLAGQTIIGPNGTQVTVPANVDDYLEVDQYGEVKLKRPSHWIGKPSPDEVAEFNLVRQLLESEFEKTKGQVYGEKDNEDDEDLNKDYDVKTED